MTVEQVVADALLTAACAAFVLDIEGFRGPNRLRVGAFGDLSMERRLLIKTAIEV